MRRHPTTILWTCLLGAGILLAPGVRGFQASRWSTVPERRAFRKPPSPATTTTTTWSGRRDPHRRDSRIFAGVGDEVIDSTDEQTVGFLDNATFDASNNTLATTTMTTTTTKPYPPTPTFRECLGFALPALGIYVCSPLMSLIDASFVGRLSPSAELAALGPASSISDCAPLPLLFLSIGATNLIAKAHASGNNEACARVTRTALGMGTAGGLLLAVLLRCFATPLSVLYCGSGATTMFRFCAAYVSIRALALPAVVLTTIAQAVLLGTKDTRTPMVSVGLAALGNLLGDLVLVKGLGRGIAGAAWATAASQVLSAGLLLRALQKRGFLAKPGSSSSSSSSATKTTTTTTWQTVQQLLAFVPFLFIMAVKIGWHNSCSATAASLGGIPAAAHTALVSVAMVCMVLGDVGSSLSQAFLPAFERVDKGGNGGSSTWFDLEAALPTVQQLLRCTWTISASVTAFCAVAVGILGGQITSDPLVLAEMRRVLPWILATLAFHGSAVTLEGLLLSRKKFRSLSACYAVLAGTVAAFQVATRKLGWGLAGVWGCYVWFCASRVVAFSALGGILRPPRRFLLLRRISREQNDGGPPPTAPLLDPSN